MLKAKMESIVILNCGVDRRVVQSMISEQKGGNDASGQLSECH